MRKTSGGFLGCRSERLGRVHKCTQKTIRLREDGNESPVFAALDVVGVIIHLCV